MSDNYSTFGRFDWNISNKVSSTLSSSMRWVNIIGAVYEFTVIVFFAVMFFIKKSGFREPYFIIYTIGCFIDAFPKVMSFVLTNIGFNIVFYYLYSFFDWYNSNFITLWNFLLALNRFIAILFSLDFSKIYSKRNTIIICIFLVLYPFLIHCFNPIYMWCQIIDNFCPNSLRISAEETDFEYYFGYASDITYAVFATILCSIAAVNIIYKKRMKDQKVEIVLLIQSFTSSICLILSTVTSWLASVNGVAPGSTIEQVVEMMRAMSLQGFLIALSDCFYNIHHYVGLLLLLIMSRNFRTKYLEFYRIPVLLKLLKRSNKVANTTQHQEMRTISIMPPESTTRPLTNRHQKITFLH